MRALFLLLAVGAGLNAQVVVPPPPMWIVDCNPGPWIVFFRPDRAALDAEARSVLRFVREVDGSACGGSPITMIGHRDAGEREGVDRARAIAVRRLLRASGIPTDRLAVRALGVSQPRIARAPGVVEPQNQRVEIVAGPALP